MRLRLNSAVRHSLALAMLASTALGAGMTALPAHANTNSAAIAPAPISGLPGSFADLVEHVSPAVVTITAARTAEAPRAGATAPGLPPQMEEFLRRFGLPGMPDVPGMVPRGQRPEARSLGSGFVIDAEGHIVTNRHVIEGATEVTVTFTDGTERTATLVGQDDRTDLAVLKVETDKQLPYLQFGDSDKMRPGDWVVAVGNPFGLGGTVTAGIVSARSRAISANAFDDYIQIDASINRGNSGGPTFNASGEVIGINTAIFSPNGGSVGIGFAIPANLAKPVIEQLKASGRVERGWLGVSLQGLTPDLADGLGLKETKGALIASVSPDSPAEKAGLQAGDVVRAINDQPVDDTRALARSVGSVAPGTELSLRVWRDGRERTVKTTVGAPPGSEQVAAANPNQPGSSQTDVAGLKLAQLDGLWRQRLSLPEDAEGVVVAEVDSSVEQIRPGDVIETVNGKKVTDPKQIAEAVAETEKQGRRNALLLIRRGEVKSFVPLPVTQAKG